MRTNQLQKKPMQTISRGLTLLACMFVLFSGTLFSQAYTITWQGLTGNVNAQNVPTGITVTQQYNGVTPACNTASNGATTSYTLRLTAAPGYNFTITSIGGAAYASSAGSKQFTFQLLNGSTYVQPNPTTIGTSSSCGGNTALNAFAIPAAGQTVTSGNQIIVTVLRAPGGASGGGYSWTRSLTVSGVVTAVSSCTAPTGLAASAITSSGADLSWGTVGGAGGYQYVVDQTSGSPAGAGTPIVGTSFTAGSLSGSTTYYLHVRSDCGSGNFSSWTTIPFTTLATCNAPTGLTATNITDNSADLSWNTVGGAGSYEYIVDQTSAAPATAGTNTVGTTYAASGLNFNTTYYLHVRSDCGSGNFSPWTTIPFTTLFPPCADPTGLVATNITDNSATLSWNPGTSVSGYEYVVDQTATAPIVSGTVTVDTFYNAMGLTFNTTYYLHVRNNCVAGNSSGWITISFTTPYPPCADPSGIVVTNLTDNSATISWDSIINAAGFEYVLDQIATDPMSAGTATADTFFNATGLAYNTLYYAHILTNCMAGNASGWVTISFTTPYPPCAAPSGLVATGITDNSATLSWDSIPGNTGFEYVIDQLATDPMTPGTATVDTFYNASGLLFNTTYYLHVRSNCVAGNSSGWTSIPFTTPFPPCADPSGMVVTNLNDNSGTISWDSIINAAGFEYVLDQIATDPMTAGTATADTFFNATGLAFNTTYYVHVLTNCMAGNASNWTTISFTTPYPPCTDPSGLVATGITDNSATLIWDSIPGNIGFEYMIDQLATDPMTAGTATVDTFYNASGLAFNTTYYLHVRNNCVAGNSSGWTTIPFTTPYPACVDPSGLIVNTLSSNGAILSWDVIASAAGYEYVIDQLITDPSGTGTATVDTFATVSGLLFNATYYLHVRTNCTAGNSSGWTTISFTTPYPLCADPTGLTAANITDSGADLSWNTGSGITGYEYVLDQVATDPAGAGTPSLLPAYTASALTANTIYYFHVRTNCTAGNSSGWTTISFTTALAPCSDPTGISVTNITNTGADISWNVIAGSPGYEYVIDQTPGDPATAGTATTSVTVTASGLTANTQYYVHVRNNCGPNFSSWITVPFTTTNTIGIAGAGSVAGSIRCYPNPVSNVLTIDLGETVKGTLQVINVEGRILRSLENENKEMNIDLTDLEAGIYFIRYTSSGSSTMLRIVKQ
jgi:hypothetical protein